MSESRRPPILGNLRAEDDYTHPLGPESNFNESMYFNFFDRTRTVGGFVRLGNRANEGRAELTVTVFQPDGSVLFTFDRPAIAHNDAFDAGGLRFDVVEPALRLRTRFRGSVLCLAEPRRMADPRRAFAESPRLELDLDLEHRAVGPMYGHAGDRDEESRSADQQFARAHYEQHMHVAGVLEIAGEKTPIEGYGLRDHSWGPRSWQAIESYEWLTMNFGPDLGAMVSIVRREAGHERTGGVLVRGDELDPIVAAAVEAEFEPDTLYHRRVHARFETRSGESHEVAGLVRGFIPLRNRRNGLRTHIGEGMTEWRLGERVGFGLSELLRQV